jgi:hypothetical protein
MTWRFILQQIVMVILWVLVLKMGYLTVKDLWAVLSFETQRECRQRPGYRWFLRRAKKASKAWWATIGSIAAGVLLLWLL